MTDNNNEVVVTGGFALTNDTVDNYADELDCLPLQFDRIKIPAGGGIAYEVPSDDPDSPDMAKEFKAVILHHNAINTYYRDKYDGSNNPPDCGSLDGKIGITSDGEVLECSKCQYAKFGSAEDGKGKACKQKRRIYLLREGTVFPTIMTLPTGSLSEFSKYIMRLLNRGKKSNQVVTKFTLKKAQSASGINYSQAVFMLDRTLNADELVEIANRSEQVKQMAMNAEQVEAGE